MLAAATAANAYLLQQQPSAASSLAPPGPYTTAAAAAMMMLPPPSLPPVPAPLPTGDAPPPLSRVSPAAGVDLGLHAHRHATDQGARYVQTMAADG